MDTPGAAPARLGRYELLARLATGGMGEIFLARLEGAAGFEKLFVIKRILPHLAGDERFRVMLIGEARIASMMTHANVCQVYELGETDGQLYIVMEYLEGSTMLPLLRKLSKAGAALDIGFIGGVLQQATDGLHYAHELHDRSGESLGIVHRDVSPSNVFLTDAGVVKVLDFGIAKVKNASAQTQTGTVKGKYAYMAPEQLRGIAVDRRADVFALGVVVYEMLALRRLFQRKTDYLTFRAVMEQPIIDVRHYRPDCPDALATALCCALDRDPEKRFATARQFGTSVLDAIGAHRRPWTQGEISDFVTMHLAEEMRERSMQIASAVSSGSRKSMLLFAQPDDEGLELEDNAPDFPPVDSEDSETPVDVRHLRGPSEERTAVNGPAANPPSLDTLRGVPAAASQQQPIIPQQQPIVVVNSRRSVIWPLVAFAMVAVSGGALFLVWRQMQNQPPRTLVFQTDDRATPSGSGVIIRGRDRADPADSDPAAGSADTVAREGQPSGSGDGAGEPRLEVIDVAAGDPADPSPVSGVARAAQPRGPGVARAGSASARTSPQTEAAKRRQKLRVAVYKHRDALTRCVSESSDAPRGIRLEIEVGPDGHPRNMTLTPERFDSSPLGTCIKNVFKGSVFPHGDKNYKLNIGVTRSA